MPVRTHCRNSTCIQKYLYDPNTSFCWDCNKRRKFKPCIDCGRGVRIYFDTRIPRCKACKRILAIFGITSVELKKKSIELTN